MTITIYDAHGNARTGHLERNSNWDENSIRKELARFYQEVTEWNTRYLQFALGKFHIWKITRWDDMMIAWKIYFQCYDQACFLPDNFKILISAWNNIFGDNSIALVSSVEQKSMEKKMFDEITGMLYADRPLTMYNVFVKIREQLFEQQQKILDGGFNGVDSAPKEKPIHLTLKPAPGAKKDGFDALMDSMSNIPIIGKKEE